jgi:hypothetical protein
MLKTFFITLIISISVFMDIDAGRCQTFYPGKEILITAPPKIPQRIKARISAIRPDSLILFLNGSNTSCAIEISSIRNLSIKQKAKSMSGYGAVAGFLIGGITSAAIGLSEFEDDCPACPPEGWPEDLPFDCSDASCIGFPVSKRC